MGIVYLLQNEAGTFLAFAIAQGMMGAFNPMYRVAADAMLADLIPQEKRTEAYSLMRMSNNLGVALGPTIGGFLAARSYSTIFYIAAAGLTTYGIMMAIFAKETLPTHHATGARLAGEGSLGGYGLILGDSQYRTLIIGFLFCMVSSTFLWILVTGVCQDQFWDSGKPVWIHSGDKRVDGCFLPTSGHPVDQNKESHPDDGTGRTFLCDRGWSSLFRQRFLVLLVMHGDHHHWGVDPDSNSDHLYCQHRTVPYAWKIYVALQPGSRQRHRVGTCDWRLVE